MPQTLSQIKSLLAEHDAHPRRRLGQSFLIDQNQLRKILDSADLRPEEIVLEVGPGTGMLTEPMLEAGARVLAVEVDAALVEILRRRIGPDRPHWRLVHGDVLAGKHAVNPAVARAMRELQKGTEGRRDGGTEGGEFELRNAKSDPSFKLVANLPYKIASPLLAVLVSDWPGMGMALVMVQEEVADRLLALPGGKAYGPLGILVQAMCEVERVMRLSPGSFWPRPKVGSTVVRLRRRSSPLTRDPHQLSAFLHQLFSKRRKQIGTILGRETPLPEGIHPAMRPQMLSVTQLARMAEQWRPSINR